MDVEHLKHFAERLQPHLYIGTFGLLFACGVAIPMPEEPVLLAAGYIAYRSGANVAVVMACAMAGVLLGDLAIFSVGRKNGDWGRCRPGLSCSMTRLLPPGARSAVRRGSAQEAGHRYHTCREAARPMITGQAPLSLELWHSTA